MAGTVYREVKCARSGRGLGLTTPGAAGQERRCRQTWTLREGSPAVCMAVDNESKDTLHADGVQATNDCSRTERVASRRTRRRRCGGGHVMRPCASSTGRWQQRRRLRRRRQRQPQEREPLQLRRSRGPAKPSTLPPSVPSPRPNPSSLLLPRATKPGCRLCGEKQPHLNVDSIERTLRMSWAPLAHGKYGKHKVRLAALC